MDAASQRGAVWLIGMMGSGKSTVGNLLAEKLGRRFVDMDARIEADAGQTISEMFSVGGGGGGGGGAGAVTGAGEAGFRAREAALVAELAASPDELVIATGGGAPCAVGALEAMRGSGLVVHLRADVDEVLARVDVKKRPLLDGTDARQRWRALAEARRSIYGRADLEIDRWGRESVSVAEELARWLSDFGPFPLSLDHSDGARELRLDLGERGYSIWLDAGWLDAGSLDAGRLDAGSPDSAMDPATRFAERLARCAPPARARIAIVTDDSVARYHLPRYRTALVKRGYAVVEVVVPDGEGSKSLAGLGRVVEALVDGGLDRGSTVLALGGGVVGDLAGFAAATLYRGIACVQIPTTLLAMVDSSVGGKTGVNLPSGKNLVGAFHQPRFVYADLTTLATLSARDLKSGLGEVVKHALLDGEEPLARLERVAESARAGDRGVLLELIASSCALKARVVAGDERELAPVGAAARGLPGGRALLNLGHTLGHAIEAVSHRPGMDLGGHGPLRHGEAVALGLLASARVARALDSDGDRKDHIVGGASCEAGLEARIASLLQRLGLPIALDAWLSPPVGDAVRAALAVDKKRAGSQLRYVALPRPGAARIVSLSPARVVEILAPRSHPAPDHGDRAPSQSEVHR